MIKKSLIVSLLIVGLCYPQKSSLFKKMTGYLPTLSEVGFLTGIVNTYLQAGSLVRVINAEIKMAKRSIKRFDELQEQSKVMWANLKTLKEINIYDMDSWASWLDRAENLVDYEATSFINIITALQIDYEQRLTVDFANDLKRAVSYDISNGDVQAVLMYYYHNQDYTKRRQKLDENNLRDINNEINIIDSRLVRLNEELNNQNLSEAEKQKLLDEKNVLSQQRRSYALQKSAVFYPTVKDRQIELLSQVTQDLAQEIPQIQNTLSQYQKDLKGLYKEWNTLVSDRSPKTVNREIKNPKNDLEDLKYRTGQDKYEDSGEKDGNISETPKADDEFPSEINTSNTATHTSLADIQRLKNRIEFQKLLIDQTNFQMELQLANVKSLALANLAFREIEKINQGKTVEFQAGNLEHHFKALAEKKK